MEAPGYTCPEEPRPLYRVDTGAASVEACSGVYEPAEDSFLALEAIDDLARAGYRPAICIDVGSGTGILGAHCAARLAPLYTVLVDLNPCAAECSKRNTAGRLADVAQCDSASCLRPPGLRALVVYNTPYLPVEDEGLLGAAWSGGLRELVRIAEWARGLRDGCLVLVYSSLSGPEEEAQRALREAGLRVKTRRVLHVFFEDIKVVAACREGG